MRTTKRLIRSVVLATAAILGGRAASDSLQAGDKEATAPDKAAADPVYLPWGVTDPDGKVGYLTLPSGDGLAAVDLATGKVFWQTREANQALVVAGNRLVARTGKDNRLRVVVLDLAAKGKRLLESEALTLPDWAVVGRPWSYQGRARHFVAEGRIVRGNLALDWWAHAGYWGGARPSPEKEKGKTAAGLARVNLETGKVEMLPAEKVGPPPWEQSLYPHGIAWQSDPDTSIKKLPTEVQAVAKRNTWVAVYLAGPRAFGLTWQRQRLADTQTDVIQAADVKTGKVLWERLVREEPVERLPR